MAIPLRTTDSDWPFEFLDNKCLTSNLHTKYKMYRHTCTVQAVMRWLVKYERGLNDTQ